jgi:hypothetical protein
MVVYRRRLAAAILHYVYSRRLFLYEHIDAPEKSYYNSGAFAGIRHRKIRSSGPLFRS